VAASAEVGEVGHRHSRAAAAAAQSAVRAKGVKPSRGIHRGRGSVHGLFVGWACLCGAEKESGFFL
jgi:hypothetical protein